MPGRVAETELDVASSRDYPAGRTVRGHSEINEGRQVRLMGYPCDESDADLEGVPSQYARQRLAESYQLDAGLARETGPHRARPYPTAAFPLLRHVLQGPIRTCLGYAGDFFRSVAPSSRLPYHPPPGPIVARDQRERRSTAPAIPDVPDRFDLPRGLASFGGKV